MRFEVKLHGPAAGHSNVTLQGPGNKLWLGSGVGQDCLGEGDRLCLDASSAHGARFQALARDDHLRCLVLGGASQGFDEDDLHEGDPGLLEADDHLVE